MKINSSVLFGFIAGTLAGYLFYIGAGGTDLFMFLVMPMVSFLSASGMHMLMGGTVITVQPRSKIVIPLENPNRYTSEQIGYIRARRWKEPLNAEQLKELHSI